MTKRIERVAVVSMHTCPLDQPGTGDAGGMNVYIRQVASRLARSGVAVDVFTRAAGPDQHVMDVDPGVRVIHLEAGPNEPVPKDDLPAHLAPFVRALLEFEAKEAAALGAEQPIYDVVHTHYWLSGWAGRLVRQQLGVPLVHSFHTLGAVKNRTLSPGDAPEPAVRLAGEERIAQTADCILAPTNAEANDLMSSYGAKPERIRVVHPGVDVERFRPGDKEAARRAAGFGSDKVVLFVGRLQPLKQPEMAVQSVAALNRDDVSLVMLGGPSGPGGLTPSSLRALGASLGARVDVRAPVPHALLPDYYRAADVVVMPSRTESFGLVALEAQACGTPVVVADVGGLRAAVRDGVTGVLVSGGESSAYAREIGRLLDDDRLRSTMGAAGSRHARRFDWRRAATELLDVYEDLVADDIASGGSLQ